MLSAGSTTRPDQNYAYDVFMSKYMQILLNQNPINKNGYPRVHGN
jgi:hypothetical protein